MFCKKKIFTLRRISLHPKQLLLQSDTYFYFQSVPRTTVVETTTALANANYSLIPESLYHVTQVFIASGQDPKLGGNQICHLHSAAALFHFLLVHSTRVGNQMATVCYTTWLK